MGNTIHLLFTRFNLRIPDSPVEIDSWTEQRFQLFEQYCVPSVLAQSSTNFKWIFFFDTQTNPSHKQRIEQLVSTNKNFHVFYYDGFEAFEEQWRKEVAQILPANLKSVITTSLDNDDALHQHFLQTIEELSLSKSQQAINLGNGLILSLKNASILFRSHQKSNPFISIVSKFNDGKYISILEKKHKLWLKDNFYRSHITKEPMWLQLVHGNNITNTELGIPSTAWDILARFQINQAVLKKKSFTGLNRLIFWKFYVHNIILKLRGKV